MFTSFLTPSVFEGVTARHLCVFYKQLEDFGRDRIGFIGERAYFTAPAVHHARGRPEWQPGWRAVYGYEPPADLRGVRTYVLPDELLAHRRRRVKSSWKLYRLLARRPLPELESAVGEAFDTLSADEPIEAALLFVNNPSVQRSAARRGIPVVHNEFGPLRPPQFVMTGYWDRTGASLKNEAARRYAAFRTERVRDRIPLFERDEILCVLRRDACVRPLADDRATYRVGLALQGEDNARIQGIGALDLLSMARQRHPAAELCIRYHTGSLARYPDSLGVTDDSVTAAAFIARCETVLTVSSGTALEAMLLGRRAVVVGDSPFAIASCRDLDPDSPGPDDQLDALNFLVFGYLVPGDLMFDAGYVRWRLSNPSEEEIYRRHLRWYRERLDVAPVGADAPSLLRAAAILASAEMDESSAVAVFGAGSASVGLVGRLAARRRVVAVFDNDVTIWGRRIDGAPVMAPAYLPGVTVTVASITHGGAMADQLRQLGYPPERIVRLR